MKKIILMLLLVSCADEKRDLRGKIITRKDSIVVVGEDTLTVEERIKYNIYKLRKGDTLKYDEE